MFGEDSEEEQGPTDRPRNCGVLSFHDGTEEALLLHVGRGLSESSSSQAPLAERVLGLVDSFCRQRHWMMHVGDEKGALLQREVRALTATTPSTIVALELGSYCGYSSTLIASSLPSSARLLAIESHPACVAWTKRMLSLADVHNCLVLEGELKNLIEHVRDALKDAGALALALVFIDHDKTRYLADLLLLEREGLLGVGTVVVADNVLSFGVPIQDYLDHVRDASGPFSSSVCHHASIEYASDPSHVDARDAVEVSVFGGPPRH